MTVKQITETDIKRGNKQPYQLGDYEVFNKNNDPEYDMIGTIDEAKELIKFHGID